MLVLFNYSTQTHTHARTRARMCTQFNQITSQLYSHCHTLPTPINYISHILFSV